MGTIRKKIIFISLMVSLLFIIITGITFFGIYTSQINSLKDQAKIIAEKGVKIIDADKLQKVINDKSMSSSEYKEILDEMIKFKAYENVRFFYTMTMNTSEKPYILVDSSKKEERDDIGEEYELEDEMQSAFNGDVVVSSKPITDKWSTSLSAYAPIKNSSGKVIAFVGVDIDVSSFIDLKNSVQLGLIIGFIVTLIFSLVVSYLSSKNISLNINKIQNNLKSMANGDLSTELKIESKDELTIIAMSINDFRMQIAKILKKIKEMSNFIEETYSNISLNTENMTAAFGEITEATNNVTNSTIHQANLSKESIKSVDVLCENVNQSEQEVNNIYVLSESSKQLNDIQKNSMMNLFNTYEQSNEITTKVSEKVNKLNDKAQQIGTITEMITSIAEQTNLLALNAAIEAARAGDNGKGFAVVADEIRNLAEQSSDSTKEINDVIKNIQETISDVVENIDINNKFSDKQYNTIRTFENQFNNLYNNIDNIILNIDNITSSMNIVNDSKDKVHNSINNINSIIEENANCMQQISASIEEQNSITSDVSLNMEGLKSNINELNNEINKFKV